MSGKRVSKAVYADLLRSLIDKRSTVSELIVRWGRSKNFVYSFVRTLHTARVIHIAAWRARPRAPLKAVYAFGDADDVLPPTTRPDGRAVQAIRSPLKAPLAAELIAFASILRELEDPKLAAEVAVTTGVDAQRMRRLLEHMRARRLLSIVDWQQHPNGGRPSPRYAFRIDQPDAPQPTSDRAAINARYRARRKARETPDPLFRTMAANGYLFQQRA